MLITLLTALLLPTSSFGQALNLRTALDEADQSSPQIQKSKSAWEETSWKRVETYSGFLPTVTAQANYLTDHKYLYTDLIFGGAPASVPAIIPTSNFVLTAQLPLFDGFASTNRWLSARSFERASQNEYDWTKFQVHRQVTLQFYRALGAKLLRDVADKNVKTLEDHLHDASLLKKAGVSTNYDVLRVEVQVSEARSELLNSTDNMDISRNKLNELLGAETDPRDVVGQMPALKTNLVDGITLDSVSQRRDLVALEQRSQGFDELESSAGRYWVPRFSLLYQYQYYNNRNDDIKDRENFRDAYQLGFNMTWNIFDGMVSAARSKESIQQRYQAEKNLQIARLRAKQDVDLWKRKYLYNSSVYRSRESDIQKSTESVRLATEGRRVGARTTTDLLDAETELFRARAGLVNAQIGMVEALINLELATGQKLYDFE